MRKLAWQRAAAAKAEAHRAGNKRRGGPTERSEQARTRMEITASSRASKLAHIPRYLPDMVYQHYITTFS
jgi:hypothetical protein